MQNIAQGESRADRIAMIEACKAGDCATVRALLEKDSALAEFEDNSIGRFAPLHYAARAGHAAVVRVLLAAGANANPFEHMLRNHCGTTTIELARLRGFTEVVAALEEAIAAGQVTTAPDGEIRVALKNRDREKVMALVSAQPALVHATDDDGNTPLHCVCEARPVNLQWVERLLNSGADLTAQNFLGFTPLHVTLYRNHAWSVRREEWRAAGFLLGHGAEYNICIAAAAGDSEAVRRSLLTDAALVHFQDSNGRRPLSCAAEFGHWGTVKLLLEHGADPNAKETPQFKTYPLVAATEANNGEMAKLLLEHGAEPKDVSAWTLYRACGTPRLLKAFLEHGVHPDTCDQEHKTTLHGMNRGEPNLECAALLLDSGANIDARDDIHQGTPLMWAALFGNLEMTKFLLARGARPNLPDDEPWNTPLFWARQRGHEEIAEVLRAHGAKDAE
jgi:ankyrin repeat protein